MPLSKPVVAMLHGWGMNARVFDALAEGLADQCEVQALDLPGHGERDELPLNTLKSWADDLVAQLPAGVTLLGWSLGGQVAMRAALDHPQIVSRLIVLASTPRFVSESDWDHGMAREALQQFGAALIADPQATLLRFLSLQTRGLPGQKALLQRLRQSMFAASGPRSEALLAGLALLADTDLRMELPHLVQPTLVIHGALDTLTPAGAGAWLAATLPQARLVEMPRAAHAPHLSHAGEVANEVGRFAHG